jgi:hypothetical protein
MNPKMVQFYVGLGSVLLSLLTAQSLCAQIPGSTWYDANTYSTAKEAGASAVEAPAPAVGAMPAIDLSLKFPARDPVELAMQRALTRAFANSFTPLDLATDFDSGLQDQAQPTPPSQTQPPANPQSPSLGDLGFPTAATQGSAADQARLDKRSHMLKIHQRLGLIDIAPLVATVVLGAGAGGKSTSTSDRWAHLALGSVTGDLYFISAYYAIRAPRIPGTQTRGQIRLHKALAWIHGPGMVLTPILGAIAFDEKSKGERVHGIASAHGAVAVVTAAAYGLAVVSVSIKF